MTTCYESCKAVRYVGFLLCKPHIPNNLTSIVSRIEEKRKEYKKGRKNITSTAAEQLLVLIGSLLGWRPHA